MGSIKFKYGTTENTQGRRRLIGLLAEQGRPGPDPSLGGPVNNFICSDRVVELCTAYRDCTQLIVFERNQMPRKRAIKPKTRSSKSI